MLIDFNDPVKTLIILAAFVVAISVHEASHAATANWLGDPTARLMGRMTLNPLRHLDVFGTIFLVVVGFGWGKPVPVDESRLRHGRQGAALVSAAGPLANLATALLVVSALVIAQSRGLDISGTWREAAGMLLLISVILTAFNFLPIPPLDGFGVLLGVLPGELAEQLDRLRLYGPGILLGIFALSWLLPINLFWTVMTPLVDVINQTIALWEQGLRAVLVS